MLSNVNIHSAVPVYRQIENQIQLALVAGELKEGDQLPTGKELAKRLGVNANTVVKAYRDLEVMGCIVTRRGMGCFVKKGSHAQQRLKCLERVCSGGNRFRDRGAGGGPRWSSR